MSGNVDRNAVFANAIAYKYWYNLTLRHPDEYNFLADRFMNIYGKYPLEYYQEKLTVDTVTIDVSKLGGPEFMVDGFLVYV
jgi:hypothetical protein